MHPSTTTRNKAFQDALGALKGTWGTATLNGDATSWGAEGRLWRWSWARFGSKKSLASALWREFGVPGRPWVRQGDGVWDSPEPALGWGSCATSTQAVAVDPFGRELVVPALVAYGEQLAARPADPRWSSWDLRCDYSRARGWSGIGPVPGTGHGRWGRKSRSDHSVGWSLRLASAASGEAKMMAEEEGSRIAGSAAPARLGAWSRELSRVALLDIDWESSPRSESGAGWKTRKASAQWARGTRGSRRPAKLGHFLADGAAEEDGSKDLQR